MTWIKWIFGLISFTVLSIGLVWLSGFIYLLLSKENPIGNTEFTTWYSYWQYYQDDSVIIKRLHFSLLISAVISYVVPIIVFIAASREIQSLHGDARFANPSEIKKSGLLNNEGIIVGKYRNKFLSFPGSQFCLLAAPTRSRKGVGIVIPNLLNFPESVVCLDIKLENYKITSKYRQDNGQEVFLFNPFDETGKTHRYNCLGYISDNPRLRVTEILSIGYSFYPNTTDFFENTARNLFLGLTLYLCETTDIPRTIGELLRLSSGKGKPVKEYIQGLINKRNYKIKEDVNEDGEIVETIVPILNWDRNGLPPLSMECVDSLNRFLSTSDNTLSSIMATFNTPLTIWASSIVDAATSENDFDLRDLRKKRMTIYFGIPANKLEEAELILNVFFNQLIKLNTNDLLHSKPELKYQCLLLMDEFAAPGRIGIIDKANSFIAGYGLRLLSIIQSKSQLEAPQPKGYGREGAKTLITNHAIKIFYTPGHQDDAEEYSKMLGTFTFKAKSVNLQERSKGSESEQRRPLMLPQELSEMSIKKQIIKLEHTKAIYCDKIEYYSEPVFMDRLKSVSTTLAQFGKKFPNKEEFDNIWGSGELSSYIPVIDLDLHEAIVQERLRVMTIDDVSSEINLNALAVDFSDVPIPPKESELEPDEIENFVTGFFDALDASSDQEETEAEEDEFFTENEVNIDINSVERLDINIIEPDNSNEDFIIDPIEALSFNEEQNEPEHEVEKPDHKTKLSSMDEISSMFDEFEMTINPPNDNNTALDLSVLEQPLKTDSE